MWMPREGADARPHAFCARDSPFLHRPGRGCRDPEVSTCPWNEDRMVDVLVVTSPACHLCEDALEALGELAPEDGLTGREIPTGAGGGALFGPCCVVFLSPASLASAVKNRRWTLLPLTFVFALGLAAVLLPVTLGVSLGMDSVRRFPTPLYGAGGML